VNRHSVVRIVDGVEVSAVANVVYRSKRVSSFSDCFDPTSWIETEALFSDEQHKLEHGPQKSMISSSSTRISLPAAAEGPPTAVQAPQKSMISSSSTRISLPAAAEGPPTAVEAPVPIEAAPACQPLC
jgi:hypothetical protein